MFICDLFPKDYDSFDMIREETLFKIHQKGEPRRGGVGPSRKCNLEEFKYLANRVFSTNSHFL
jgi:hypothetical protein